MELDAGIRRFPRCLGGKVFRHVRFGTAGLVRVEQGAGLVAHEIGGLDLDERLGNRELHTLVLADGPAEDLAFAGIGGHLVDKPVAVTDAFCGDQRTFCIKSGHYIFETVTFFSDKILGRDFQIVEEQLVCLVVHHVVDRAHAHA